MEAQPQSLRVFRIPQQSPIGMLQVFLMFLLIAVLAGSCLLLSAAESTELVDGAVQWRPNSPLRAVVQLLCLGYEVPTINAGEIKNYLLGIGAGVALLAITISILSRSQENDVPAQASRSAALPSPGIGAALQRHPVLAAQVLAGCYLLWSFASSRWSSASTLSLAATIPWALYFLWAFAIAQCGAAGPRFGPERLTALPTPHSPRPTIHCTHGVVIVCGLAALVAVWYFHGRNPVLAAKFPFGNPSFLAACLIPGVLLSLTTFCEQLRPSAPGASPLRSRALIAAVAIIAFIACAWAMYLSRSRGPAVGLIFGMLAVFFFAVRGRWKAVPVVIGLTLIAAGGWYAANNLHAASPTGRTASMRFRLYAWDYAWRLFLERPLTGHGQGGFVFHGDFFARHDVLSDPLALGTRVEHAHCEWLEIAADLGVVGLLLFAGVCAATIAAGLRVLRSSSPKQRWVLIGLMGSFIGLLVAESFGVGLRVSGVPSMFFTILGLLWAASSTQQVSLTDFFSANPNRRILAGVVGGVLGLAAITVSQMDFEAARSAYRALQALDASEDDKAIEHAANALLRLNPQRALENLYRFVEANAKAAERLVDRGMDRNHRAGQVEPPDVRLQALAAEDFQAAAGYVQSASRGLQQLVSASPGFINSGVLEARVNLLEARMASIQGNAVAADASLKTAAAAIEREIARQPFSPHLAIDYVRTAARAAAPEQIITILARPLRHNRAQEAYVGLLAELLEEPTFAESLAKAAQTPGSLSPPDQKSETDSWMPEKQRLAGIAGFLRNDFQAARDVLLLACGEYERMAGDAPLGAASCFAELADVTFFADPRDPASAIEHAKQAIALAPWSQQGRAIIASVEQRLVHYYLAAGDEKGATDLLRKSAPPQVTDAALQRELGQRLRRLCESLLRKREDGASADPSAPGEAAFLADLEQWIERAKSLSQEDASVYMVAAQIALLRRDADDFARELATAVDRGIRPDALRQALDTAANANVTHPLLDTLRARLGPESPTGAAAELAQPADEPQNADEQSPQPQ